jgi:hypothetical protein
MCRGMSLRCHWAYLMRLRRGRSWHSPTGGTGDLATRGRGGHADRSVEDVDRAASGGPVRTVKRSAPLQEGVQEVFRSVRVGQGRSNDEETMRTFCGASAPALLARFPAKYERSRDFLNALPASLLTEKNTHSILAKQPHKGLRQPCLADGKGLFAANLADKGVMGQSRKDFHPSKKCLRVFP